ncbi:DUF3107 family protein [Staphylococcus epidermidis]|nr:DUF3107 family protein [Staphylococcus epidermidis]
MNNELIRLIKIGINETNKEFIIKEVDIGKLEFDNFEKEISEAIEGKKKCVSLLTINNDYLYINFKSVSYINITQEYDEE